MAGYPYVSHVADPNTQKALQAAWGIINTLQNRITALEQTALTNAAAVNANGQRLTNVGEPQAESDAATVAFVRALVNAQVETF